MKRDPKMEAKIARAAERLGQLVRQYADATGVRIEIFCETGRPYLLDSVRDDALSGDRHHGPPYRQDRHEDGGAIITDLPTGGTTWDGGGW